MTDLEMDRLIRNALLDTVGAEFQKEIASAAVMPVSGRYRQNMKTLMDRPQRAAKTDGLSQRCFRTFAGAAAACLLLFGTLMAASPAARAVVRNWWIQQTETGWFSYMFTGEQRTDELPLYEIRTLPDGYAAAEDETFLFSLYRHTIYQNEDGQEIVLTYGDMFQGAELRIYTEDMDQTTVAVNGYQGVLLTPKSGDGAGYLVWMDDTAGLQFILKADLSREELLSMAESVAEISH